jgi:hypothetical protein
VEGRLTDGGSMFRREGGGKGVNGDSRRTCTSEMALGGHRNIKMEVGGTRRSGSPKGRSDGGVATVSSGFGGRELAPMTP